jgi:dTDP-glucose 4,6-dehydratase
MRVLVTGAYGFIGSHFVHMLLQDTEHTVVGFDRDVSQRDKDRLLHTAKRQDRFQMIHGDLTGNISGLTERIDAVVHFAAETFVDHSIKNPSIFVQSNILGTFNLLEDCRRYGPSRYIQVSTDEVYGPILEGEFSEDAMLRPGNPYSATKAAADMLVLSYKNTYGLNATITRTENNYGTWQHCQKVLPTFVRCAMANEPLPIYGDGEHRRQWLHVEDHCRAIRLLMNEEETEEIYHIGGGEELTNNQLASLVLEVTEKPSTLTRNIPDNEARPGHDRRYALNVSKIRALGWVPEVPLKSGLVHTIKWFMTNPWWSL